MFRVCGCVVLLTVAASVGALAQARRSASETARALYYGAEYEQALAVLDHAEVSNSTEAVAVELLRGASLFALGRTNEAERTFERLVRLKPDLRPDQLGMTPWITVRFAAVRVRVLSEMERQKRSEQRRQATAELPQRSEPEFYTRADASVQPPVAIREQVPELPAIKGADYSRSILLLVDIGLDGSVERLSLEGSIHLHLDDLIRQAASAWLYRPATLNGHAVRFRKALRIDIR